MRRRIPHYQPARNQPLTPESPSRIQYPASVRENRPYELCSEITR